MGAGWVLDAYCGVGGATRGLQMAGHKVLGVDITAQPDYCGDDFYQGDAVEFIAEHGHKFTAICASPPCQEGCTLTAGTNRGRIYPQLIPATRAALVAAGRPWVIENPHPSRAPMRCDCLLCGDMFHEIEPDGSRHYLLEVIRHRQFETFGFTVPQPPHETSQIKHRGYVSGMRHGIWRTGPYVAVYGEGGGKGSVPQWQQAMGIDWTNNRKSIAEAVPPLYYQHIGQALTLALNERGAA